MPDQEEPDLRTLIYQRGAIKARVTRFSTYLSSVHEDNELAQIILRREKTEPAWREFEDVQYSIELLDSNNAAIHATERESFENSYFTTMAEADRCISRMTPAVPLVAPTSSNSETHTQVKLPTINLPTFSGAYDQWLTFVDTFQSLIHDNSSISSIQKLHYLRSALTDDAAQVIQSLEISALNYDVAWALLKERYQNKRIIVQNHVRALFELPVVVKESHGAIRLLLDTVSRHLRALKSLGQPIETWDTLIIHIITSKFDSVTKREWESTVDAKELPRMIEMNKFLQQRCHLLQTLEEPTATVSRNKLPIANYISKTRNHSKAPPIKSSSQTQAYVNTHRPLCPKCSENHLIFHCKEFLKLPVSDRFKEIKRLNLCINCLRPDHHSNQCSSGNCRICARKHNSLLHFVSSEDMTVPEPGPVSTASVNHHTTQFQVENHVILSTALIIVYDYRGEPQQCRALLDSGSQSNFITTELSARLNLKLSSVSLPVTGVNQSVTHVNQIVKTRIQSRFNNFHANLDFLVLPKITERLPALQLNRDVMNIPNNLRLADPQFNNPATVDMLLGAEIFWNLLCVGQIKSKPRLPILQKTHFGWIVSGKLDIPSQTTNRASHCHLTTNSMLQQQLSNFWNIEEAPAMRHLSAEESACEEHFILNTTRDVTGRFVVNLPFRKDPTILGDSKSTALKRFSHLERKFSKNPTLHSEYSREVMGYLQQGHMTQVPDSEIISNQRPTFYFPHHGVFKESSTSTKLRVVFDGSARTSNDLSLNDLLMVGPTIQEDLVSIVTRFRIHQYVITADIVQMYRQIRIHPDQADLQRIVWRESPQLPLQTFRLNTVTFGTASAPFLAIRCLKELASIESKDFPLATSHIDRDFYVDDLLTGAETAAKVKELKSEITEVLEKGGFRLHKWNSNCPELREPPYTSTTSLVPIQVTKQNSVKTLGLLWNSEEDNLSYQVKSIARTDRCTKRRILSIIAEIFDPLGLLGPIIVSAKIMLQQLWQLNLGWDETVPMNLFTKWQRYESDLQQINEIQVSRCVIGDHPVKNIQLHGFCDASEAAYGACIFIRYTDSSGVHFANLLCAKSRVSPLKTLSIPRLELCSALLLAQLVNRTVKALNFNNLTVKFWTDSSVALAWISASPHHWKTFVANRTSEIQKLSSGSWHHVRTHENPADLLSRGATPQQLSSSHLWWHGPQWLIENEDQWPKDLPTTAKQEVPEYRNKVTSLLCTSDSLDLFNKYASLTKLVNVLAYCLRFKTNCLSSQERQEGPLQVHERQQAMTRLLQIAQRERFSQEFHQLKCSGQVHAKSKLLSLAPFIDDHELLRVGGRLQYSVITNDQKHPIILPSKHRLTHLIVLDVHLTQLHAGVQATLASVRLQYWLISGHQTTKGIIRSCIRCFRVKPTLRFPLMGQLPSERITPSRPFSKCGVDYCGPFLIHEGGPRSKRKVKSYAAVFVCLSTRATHLELVGNLTTEAFLGALKRFIGRRGKPTKIFSDNATNFTGARNELLELKELFSSEMHQTRTVSWLAEIGIEWSFIPPASPHFGGIWEAAVKSTKHHLRRVVGDASLTFEELNTVLVQIESCLNSRPLTPISSDPNDYSVLTPGHFLIGDSLSAIEEPSLTEIKINRLSRWQRVQQITQHFWTRWSKEYLSQLQQRHKWNKAPPAVKVGSLVILKEDRTAPLQWPLGRITEVHPGQDGIVRVATVQTQSGTFKRAVSKLCFLPLDS